MCKFNQIYGFLPILRFQGYFKAASGWERQLPPVLLMVDAPKILGAFTWVVSPVFLQFSTEFVSPFDPSLLNWGMWLPRDYPTQYNEYNYNGLRR